MRKVDLNRTILCCSLNCPKSPVRLEATRRMPDTIVCSLEADHNTRSIAPYIYPVLTLE